MMEDKIKQILDERKQLLALTKESIRNNADNLIENINNLERVLDYDEECIGKYHNNVKVQDLIETLSAEIINCITQEDIEKLRNKINYYINKVKREIKKRCIDENTYNSYYEKVCFLRKDIAKYLRFIKREKVLSQIVSLNARTDLSDEEMLELKKLIKMEKAYNKRYLGTTETIVPDKYHIENHKKNNKKALPPINLENHRRNTDNSLSCNLESFTITKTKPRTILERESIDELLLSRIMQYEHDYDIQTTYSYDGSVTENMHNFIRNIPLYNQNKKKIRQMQVDCASDSSNDMIGFIEYTKSNNSIMHGLRSIFAKSRIYQNQGIYLDKHYASVEWIKRFLHANHLSLNEHQLVK